MSESIILTYFNTTGRGEPIRYILSYAGVDFEDKRIARADWPEIKNTIPGGKIPVLEVDGELLTQSIAICRYLGQKYNLEPEDLWKRAKLEAVMDDIRDLTDKITKFVFTKTPEAKKDVDDGLTALYTALESIAEEGCFYGSEVSWIDIFFAGFSESLELFLGKTLEPYSNLTALIENIRSNEGVSNYIKNRPQIEKPPTST